VYNKIIIIIIILSKLRSKIVEKENDKKEKSSVFMCFVLLKEPIVDIEQAKRAIIADWATISEEESDKEKLIFYNVLI